MTRIENLTFIKGKAIVKNGRKTIAKIYDRNEFFKGTKLEGSFKQFPFSIEMSVGIAECKTLNECKQLLEKYS